MKFSSDNYFPVNKTINEKSPMNGSFIGLFCVVIKMDQKTSMMKCMPPW